MAERAMRYGAVLPGGTATEQLDQAMLAERAGWDAVFVWEAAYGVDAWSLLAAMAARTERVRLGTMLTPLPWRRPWKVASQVATLDQLSGGRAILGVGVGANVLIGGFDKSITLQPLSIEGNTGLNVAAGVAMLDLKFESVAGTSK